MNVEGVKLSEMPLEVPVISPVMVLDVLCDPTLGTVWLMVKVNESEKVAPIVPATVIVPTLVKLGALTESDVTTGLYVMVASPTEMESVPLEVKAPVVV
jgi:hypothetical protein